MSIRQTSTLEKRNPYQYGLLGLLAIVTLFAIGTWLTIRVGLLPLVGAAFAIVGGLTCGCVIGLCYRRLGTPVLCATLGSLVSVGCVVAWYLFQAIVSGELEHFRSLPVAAYFHSELFWAASIAVLIGAVPMASVSAVADRPARYSLVLPALTCALVVIGAGLAFAAYGIWTAGEFPQTPLPWPVALAIPVTAGALAAAGLGLVLALLWAGLRHVTRHQGRPEPLAKEPRTSGSE